MKLISGQDESEMGLYDDLRIKAFIEANPDFRVELSEEEEDEFLDMFQDDDSDDDVIQNRWILLIYIKVVGRSRFATVRDKILEFYSLAEFEYDPLDDNPAKCHPIHGLFTESRVYLLTAEEIWILKNAIYQYDPVYDQYLHHIADEATLATIRSKAIPPAWIEAQAARDARAAARAAIRRMNQGFNGSNNPAA